MITTHETRNDLVIGHAEYKQEIVTMSAAATLAKGTVLGRQTTSTKLSYFDRDATDGTEEPVAVLTHDLVFSASGDLSARVLVSGKVAQGKLVEYGDTTAFTKAIIDKIIKNTGVIPQVVREMSVYDNE